MKLLKKLFVAFIIFLSLYVFQRIDFFHGVIKEEISPASYPASVAEWNRIRLQNPYTNTNPEMETGSESFKAGDMLFPEDESIVWKDAAMGLFGGRVRAFAIDYDNEDVLLAGGASGGVWRSENGGVSWTKTAFPEGMSTVSVIKQDIREGKRNTWYYGTGEFKGSAGRFGLTGDGICKSVDGGRTWEALAATRDNAPQVRESDFEFVSGIEIKNSSLTADEMYASVNYGKVFRSYDEGLNWQKVYGPEERREIFTEMKMTPSLNILYLAMGDSFATDFGIRRSENGTDWVNITPPEMDMALGRIVIGVSPADENAVYFLESDALYFPGHRLWKYTYLSGDGTGSGGSWENLTDYIPNGQNTIKNISTKKIFSSQGGYDLMIAVHPENSNTVFIGGVNLYRSTDGFLSGDNLAFLGGDLILPPSGQYSYHEDQHALVFSRQNPPKAYSCHDGGISMTEDIDADLVEWTAVNNGIKITQFYSVAIDHSADKDYTVVGGTQDIGTFLINTNSDLIKKIGGGDGGFCAIYPGREYYFTSMQNGIVSRIVLDENGNQVGPGTGMFPPLPGGTALFINPFIIDPVNENTMFYAGGTYVWRNRNITAPAPSSPYWQKLEMTVIPEGSISALECSVSPAGMLYYGTSSGKIYRLSSSGTDTPDVTNVTSEHFPPGYINSIAVNKTKSAHVLAAFSNYGIPSIFSSEDGGENWADVSGNLEEYPDGSGSGPSVRCVEILQYQDKTYYFAGTSRGLFFTNSLAGSGTAWQKTGTASIGSAIVEMVDSRDSDGFIAAATHGNGLYTAALSPGTSVEDPDDKIIPATLTLLGNFPNPFNGGTEIRFQLSESGIVTVTVYSETGRLVRKLQERRYDRGEYSVHWDAKNDVGRTVSSGMYVVRIAMGRFVTTGKMIYLR